MSDPAPHARIYDIPEFPCPPRVRDIPSTPNSWGFLDVRGSLLPGSTYDLHRGTMFYDELGFLWVNGESTPSCQAVRAEHPSPGSIVYWTPQGIGLWIHPRSLRMLDSVSRLDLQADKGDRWLPVAEVGKEMPAAAAKFAADYPPPVDRSGDSFLSRSMYQVGSGKRALRTGFLFDNPFVDKDSDPTTTDEEDR